MPFTSDDPYHKTSYSITGDGDSIVLIHGVGLDRTMWELQVAEWCQSYRVISYDMMGHGESFKPACPYTLSMYVEQLYKLTVELGLQRVHLVGFSMGGLVAQAFAARHADKTVSLTVISSVAMRSEQQRVAVLGRVEEVESKGHLSTIPAALARWFDERFTAQHGDLVEWTRHRLESNDSAAYLSSYRVFATADEEVYCDLPKIQCPTLIVTGDLDQGSTPGMARMMAERIPDSQVVIMQGIRHMLPLEAAGPLNELIVSFVQKVGSSNEGRSDCQ